MNKFTSLSVLNTLSEEAPPLPAHLSELLVGEVGGLPSFTDLAEGLELPQERGGEGGKDGARRLPNRIVSGIASGIELALWASYSSSAIHEVLSVEYIAAIVNCMKENVGEGGTLLEIGAGNGQLSEILRKKLDGFCSVIAVDDFTSAIAAVSSVIEMGCEEALEKYKPTFVLCSWMSPGRDFSAAIGKCESVRGYLLLGEADSSTCGDAWATWGVVPIYGCRKCEFEGCGRCDLGVYEDTVKGYVGLGFRREEVEAIEEVQICRFDSSEFRGYSSAYLFARE